MRITSFDNNKNKIKRDINQGNLLNLFQKNIVYINGLKVKPYIVPREFEMRLDKICKYLYGTDSYVEELMLMNDILNPYSIKEGQIIYYYEDINNMEALYVRDDMIDNNLNSRLSLINSSQTGKNKSNILDDKNLPPTIKPSNLKQIKITDNNQIKIINSFE